VRRATGTAEEERRIQAILVHEVFGPLPFRPVTLDPACLTGSKIQKLARVAYDERLLPSGHMIPECVPILADALEEAGCTNADILSHCRGPWPHVRGCWVVDLLLAKE
jgi:hypothetical protein